MTKRVKKCLKIALITSARTNQRHMMEASGVPWKHSFASSYLRVATESVEYTIP